MDRIADALAKYSVAVEARKLPEHVIDEVKRRLIDGFACGVGGLGSPTADAVARLAGQRETASGGVLLWGTSIYAAPEASIFANACAVRYLDFNDDLPGGHPSDYIAAVVGVAEWAGASVDRVVSGIVVAYEVFGELGRLWLRQYGWDMGTHGVVAAACAAGHVLGLNEAQMVQAISIAATSNVGLRTIRKGQLSMWKGMATPYASQAGVQAAFLASQGVTGPEKPFEGEYGWFEKLSGEFSIAELADPASPTYILRTDSKAWPVEYNSQLAVWAGRHIWENFDLDDIAAVDVFTDFIAWNEVGREPEKWHPTTRETADHSLPYILATSMQSGKISSEDFTPEAIASEATRRIMPLIRVEEDKTLTENWPAAFKWRIRVTRKTGESSEFEVSEPLGRHTNPMSIDDLREKYTSLTRESVIEASACESLLQSIENLDFAQSAGDFILPLKLAR